MKTTGYNIAVKSFYRRCTRVATLVAANDVQHVVMGVRGQGVAPSIQSERRATRQTQFELDVSRLGQVILHVPVAVSRYDVRSLLAQRHMAERRPVGRETPGGKRVGSCRINKTPSLYERGNLIRLRTTRVVQTD